MKFMKTALWTSAALIGLAFFVASPAAADFVINDDLIVDGSACIGFDCVNGESFGFDTIRIKENNLRIKALDTSNSASFPTNDWQITFNDSSNGGAEKFSIDDITGGRTPFTIEASAPSHSLYVDSSGRLGLGTNNPVVELHVVDGDTPTLRLEQNGSSGFTPQTWDLAGNETNFFIRDVTNGSQLPFRVRPDAPTSSIDVAADGDVGLGTSSPDASLHVRRTDGSAAILVTEESGTTAQRTLLKLENNGQSRMVFADTASGANWFNGSAGGGDMVMDDTGTAGTAFRLSQAGDLTISGALTTSGATCNTTPCDRLFDIAKADGLESISEHAVQMWKHHYLPGVGPTSPDAPMNISEKTAGILNELEKAHIYIEQLHEELNTRNQRMDQLEKTVEGLEEMKALVASLVEVGQ